MEGKPKQLLVKVKPPNGKNCTSEEEAEEDKKRMECFMAADALFQNQLSTPQENYAKPLCEQITNKVNYCIPSFNQKCSTDDQIQDFQLGNILSFV
jgi:hypothetical protein